MRGRLLADANVLIDYAKADRRILKLTSRHVAPLFVVSTMLHAEVDQLDDAACRALGITVVEPSAEQMEEAGRSVARLSFHDWLCLIVARDEGHACLTNDVLLRKACAAAGVSTVWGLELMIDLVAVGRLSEERALRTAGRIQRDNPHHVTERIMARFRARLAAKAR